ncbi:hypothetical protein V1478_018560 [Vespula squamosa]|uniref:Translocon at the inner envelope membrane of chloroplasts 214 n=1 Tax=Vespula squamosa TaxID=30214 RepID=A0ABD1ZT39_VESSQ
MKRPVEKSQTRQSGLDGSQHSVIIVKVYVTTTTTTITRRDETKPNQTRPDQTTPDETRPDETRREETRRDDYDTRNFPQRKKRKIIHRRLYNANGSFQQQQQQQQLQYKKKKKKNKRNKKNKKNKIQSEKTRSSVAMTSNTAKSNLGQRTQYRIFPWITSKMLEIEFKERREKKKEEKAKEGAKRDENSNKKLLNLISFNSTLRWLTSTNEFGGLKSFGIEAEARIYPSQVIKA